MTTESSFFGNVIYSYTRADAIRDGVLVDVSKMGGEAGFKYPVAITKAVHDRYVQFPKELEGTQDEDGRLWDILFMFGYEARTSAGESQILFKLYVAMPDNGDWLPNEGLPEFDSNLTRETHRLVTLKGICGPGDDMSPVITILMPNED